MPKRTRASSTSSTAESSPNKRANTSANGSMSTGFAPIKVTLQKKAAAVDSDPPLPRLVKAVENNVKNPSKGDSVVYWMRFGDLRINDNRALSLASKQAKKDGIPLAVLFVISPQDWYAHDRGARRIDFVLRNLSILQTKFNDLDIPLHVVTHSPRKDIPRYIIEDLLGSTFGATRLYANIEYEVDELRRDTTICQLAKEKKVQANFVHDKCIVDPGVVTKKDGSTYAVYSPFQRLWLATLNNDLEHFLEDCPEPENNPGGVREGKLAGLFDTPVPESVPGFEVEDDDRRRMIEVWPAGEEAAQEMLERFMNTEARRGQMAAVSPIKEGAHKSDKKSRVKNYAKERDVVDKDSTSRLSPYLASGIISARRCVRSTMSLANISEVDGGRTTGVGRWVQELAWRDFYVGVLTGFPRVSMGRPFLEKYAEVAWESYQKPDGVKVPRGRNMGEGEEVQAWKDGRTGVPIVDAAMRCAKEMGWMHNRCRMIVAMYLTKDLMIDWRVGERYFMETFVDGDLASNNGGWQWSASTGVDPAPYFRIFNPFTQSTKADPSGDFIRKFVPELADVRGDEIHHPNEATARRCGYPLPIVKHDEARQRALRRFKNPGEE